MRRKDRKVVDTEEIKVIIANCQVMRLAMVDNGMPYIVPLNYGWSMDAAGKLTLFFHSAKKGRKIDILAANQRVCFEMDAEHQLIQAEEACEFGYNYASVIGSGLARQLKERAEKEYALNRIMLNLSGRDDFSFPQTALDATAVFSVQVEEYAAKRCKYV